MREFGKKNDVPFSSKNRQKPTQNRLDIPLFLPSFSNRGLEIAHFPEIRGIFDSKNESLYDFFHFKKIVFR